MTEKEFLPLTHPRVFPVFVHEHPDMFKEIVHLFFPDVEIKRLIPSGAFWEYFGIHTDMDEESAQLNPDEAEYLIDDIAYQTDGTAEVRLLRFPLDDEDCEERETEMIACLFSRKPANSPGNALSRFEVVDILNENRRLDYSPRILSVSFCTDDEKLNDEQKAFLKYLKEGKPGKGSTPLVNKVHGEVIAINRDQGWRTFMDFIESIQSCEAYEAD